MNVYDQKLVFAQGKFKYETRGTGFLPQDLNSLCKAFVDDERQAYALRDALA